MDRKSDAGIRTRIMLELKREPRIGWAEIGVELHHGVVTLKGSVTTYAKKLAAEEAAFRVAGVLNVVNELEVIRSGALIRTDEDLARAVRDVLEWDALIPGRRIRSTVSAGWVTLEGCVDRWREREAAEHTVLRLQGVVGVINQIR